ncbi:MAG: DNA polymerase I [Candidatus Paceibacterota bacterium]|jgi:DNA polymerase-1
MKKFVIIDSFALAHRSYHALPPLVSPEGVLVNGVYGFMLVFLKMLQELKPDYLVATFDLAQPTFRHKEYKEYKAKRVKAPENFYEQIEIIKEMLKIWGIPILEKEGFEADDIIGTIAQKFQKNDLEIIILTGDLDTLQLVNDNIHVYTLRKGLQDRVIYDTEEIKKRYGLLPSQLLDFKALKGDPSDNVPGVPGVGEKTASKLIKEFNSLDNLYFALENQSLEIKNFNIKLKERLIKNKDQAYLSRHLVTIEKDVDLNFQLEESVFRQPPEKQLTLFLQKLGFQSLIKRIFNFYQNTIEEKQKIIIEKIESQDKLNLLQNKIEKVSTLGIFLDYQGYKYGERKIFGLYFVLSSEEIFYLPYNFFKELKNLVTTMQACLCRQGKIIFTLGAKEITEEIKEFSQLNLEDIAILAWLIDSERKNYNLESLTRFFLKEENFLSTEDYLRNFLNLAETIRIKISSLTLDNIWTTIEKPLIPILAQMEMNGILINKQTLQQLQEEVEKEIKILENKIYQLAQKTFNINSYQQLSEVLFSDLQLDASILKKTSSGKFSTDIFELSKIKDSHLIVPFIIDYRQLEKLKTAFLDPLPLFVNEKTQRIHTIWKQTGTATGRLSSEKPNLQNIPSKGEWGKKIRKAFEAAPGFSFLSLDYSQIELRIAAHLSLDPKMIEAFKENKDIHTLTASYINNISEDKVTSEMRKLAKILNFSIIYGIGNRALSETAGISLKEAKQFKEEYFSDFSGLKTYLEHSLEQAKKLGYTETIFGRKRFLPLIGSLGQIGRQEERIAVNMPIQGLAADIIKLTMVKISEFIKNKHLEDDIKLILQIHDELILEIKSGIIKEVAPQLQEIMEQVVKLEVPLRAEATIGKNWAQL